MAFSPPAFRPCRGPYYAMVCFNYRVTLPSGGGATSAPLAARSESSLGLQEFLLLKSSQRRFRPGWLRVSSIVYGLPSPPSMDPFCTFHSRSEKYQIISLVPGEEYTAMKNTITERIVPMQHVVLQWVSTARFLLFVCTYNLSGSRDCTLKNISNH